MKINATLFAIFLFLNCLAQKEFDKGFVGFGYTNGNLTSRPGNLQADLYARSVNTNEAVTLPKRMDGISFTFMGVKEITEKAEVFMEMQFTNRSFVTDKSPTNFELKARINTYQFVGVGGRISVLRFGFSILDINRITLKVKGDEFEKTGLTKWIPYYQKKAVTNFGSTFKLGFHFPMGEVASFELLGVYQTVWFPNNFSVPFRSNNLGINATFLVNFLQ